MNRRMLTYVLIALIVGAALALAVALASSGAGTSGASAGAAGEVAGASLYSESTDAAALAAADPAKEQPLLDKFTSKDPFIPFPTPGASTTPSPSPSSSTQPSTFSAKIKVDGTTYNVMVGDKVPGGSAAAFTISGITSNDVTFKIIDGELENGEKSFSVNLGEAVTVTEKASGVSYDISVLAIGAAGSGGGSGGSGTTHSITVLSVTSQNGTALVTIEVDGKTYSDKKVGDVIVTSWGEIEIIGHRRERPDRDHHARRPDAHAARRAGGHQVRPREQSCCTTGRPQAASSCVRPRLGRLVQARAARIW